MIVYKIREVDVNILLLYYLNNKESFSKTDEEQQRGWPSTIKFAKVKYLKVRKYFEEMSLNNEET